MTSAHLTNGGRRLGRLTLLAYALPASALALPTIPIFIHLPALYGDTLGLGLAVTGTVLLLARLFDTITDPLAGWLSDRIQIRGARRKPWILLGALIAGPGLYQLLSPPTDVDAAYLLIWSVVLYAGWTLIAVPYFAWAAELSNDYDERSRITAWREGASLLGILVAGGVAAMAGDGSDASLAGAQAVADAAIVLGAVTIPIMLWLVPDATLVRSPSITQSTPLARRIVVGAKTLIRNKPFLRLLGAWFVNGVANGIPSALFFLYLDHALGISDADRPLFVLAYFLAAVAAIPVWLYLSRRLGKHRAWCWAMVLTCAAFVFVPVIGILGDEGARSAFLVVCLVTGAGLGADLALPPSIQADVVDYDTLRQGESRAGLQFALWGMATKFALALSVGIALPSLELLGFDPKLPTEQGIFALTVIYAFAPVVIKLMAIVIMWRFPIDFDRHALIRRRLDQRKSRKQEP